MTLADPTGSARLSMLTGQYRPADRYLASSRDRTQNRRHILLGGLPDRKALLPSRLIDIETRAIGGGARSECEDDRRGTFALLTEGGRTYASGAIERHEQEIHNLLGGVLSSTEEEMLVTLLHRIRDQVNPAAAQLVLPSKIEELPPATTR